MLIRGGDMLMLTTCTLMLTDDAFAAFLSEINQLAETYMRAPWIKGCKAAHADFCPGRRAGMGGGG